MYTLRDIYGLARATPRYSPRKEPREEARAEEKGAEERGEEGEIAVRKTKRLK